MAPELSVAVAQPATRLGDLAWNVHAHVEVVRRAAARVVVFPELSLTGYGFGFASVEPDDAALEPLMRACAEGGVVALAGAPVAHDGGQAIGVLAIDGAGARVAYRKMSLGGDELVHYRPGEAPAAVEIDGWRIGVGVCKDTRIERHLQMAASLGIDMYTAGLVHAPDEVGEFAVRARRIAAAYGVPVAFAGAAGAQGGGYDVAGGGSGIWDRDGVLIEQAGADVGAVVTATASRAREE